MSRIRRHIALATLLMLPAVVVLALPSNASAAVQTTTYDLEFTGSVSKNLLTIDPVICDPCIPDIFFDDEARSEEEFGLGAEATIDSRLEWTAAATDVLTYNDTLLRQGQTLDTRNTLTTGAGTVDVHFSVWGRFGIYERHPDFGPSGCGDPDDGDPPWSDCNWVPTTASVQDSADILGVSIPCVMPLPGESPRDCTSAPTNVTVFSLPVAPGVSITLGLQFSLTVTVDGSGVITLRTAEVVGGTTVAAEDLTFTPTSPAVVDDPLWLSCSQPAGNDLTYALTDNRYTADTALSLNISPTLGIELDLFPDPDPWVITTKNLDLFEFPTLNMSAPDVTKVLGPLLADNVPPVADPGGPYTGVEGTAVTFDGRGSSDNCGFPTLRWDFSDGGVAFGPTPSHVFADNGTYSGLLTATDVVGNTATATFVVTIGNVAPVANAGPDGSAAWGRLVQFNGAGTDPGAADQATLTYRWDFGDGTPSATGGPNVLHAYTTPGTYSATLRVCDKDGACHEDMRDVVVRKRDVALGALGITSGTYDTPTSLSASLVDEFGQNVSGRSITFQVGTDTALSSNTNSSGIATTSYTPGLAAGPYTSTSSFGGDALYNATTGAGPFTVAKKATTTTYTGATSGAPNKVVVLSATLVDATGTPLSGRTINFQLGTQSASAQTDANGFAAVGLKLSQKNGTYSVSATWTPTGADGDRYTGSGNAKVFKLQAK